jgi:hypothetical protein
MSINGEEAGFIQQSLVEHMMSSLIMIEVTSIRDSMSQAHREFLAPHPGQEL